jgi:cytochrome bd-type quinol oxidase subunit 2
MLMTTVAAPPRRRPRRDWPILTGLFLLALVPSLAGGVRAAQLTGGVERTAANARFVDQPAPVLVHIVAVVLFAFLGALQLAPRFRQRHRRWHRVSGRVVAVAGLAVALSGLWMTAFYDLPDSDNAVTNAARYVVGTLMLVSIVLGFAAIRRRDFHTHKAWMLRAYAIAMGAGTQVFTSLPLLPLDPAGPNYPAWRCVAMISAWVLNLAVAEIIIRRTAPRRRPAAVPATSSR